MPISKNKDENFFKTWTPAMAYVLGFFTADGSMRQTKRGTHFIEFQITDRELLFSIRDAMRSDHKITERPMRPRHCKPIYRLQIGSRELFEDLCALGMMQNKTKYVRLPTIPDVYFGDFLRGYFDGDGNVVFSYYRKAKRPYLSKSFATRFTSGSRTLLMDLKNRIVSLLDADGSFYFAGGAWRLSYSHHSSEKLFQSMYHEGDVADLIYLVRKYKIFLEARDAVVAQFG